MKKTGLILVLLAAAPVRAETVSISSADCRKIAYVGGVSTTGQPVVPADLDGGYQLDLPRTFSLPVNVELEKNYHLWDSLLLLGEIPVAHVEVRDGQVYLNGKAIINTDVTLLNEACNSVQK